MEKTSPENAGEERDDLRERISAAATVAKLAELESVVLRRCEGEASDSAHEGPVILAVDCNTDHVFNRDSLCLSVLCDVTVRLLEESSEGEEHGEAPAEERCLVYVNCLYEASYSVPSAPPREREEHFFSAFAELNGPFNVWPYLRETVQSLSGKMGLPPLTIPLYRVPRPVDERAGVDERPRLAVVGGK